MSTVLDDVTNEKIDAQHIRRRVADWDTRLQALYGMIGGWLPEGWTAHEGAPVRMHEELMRKSVSTRNRYRLSNSSARRAKWPSWSRVHYGSLAATAVSI